MLLSLRRGATTLATRQMRANALNRSHAASLRPLSSAAVARTEQKGDGMDLFARALAAQKAKQAQANSANAGSGAGAATGETAKAPGQQGQKQEKDEDLEEDLTPEEEERRRRWKEQAEEAERKQMAGRGRLVGGLAAVSLLGGYIYMGLATEDDKEGGFSGHHNRVRKYLNMGAKSVVEPPSVKLLPDPLPDPYQRPYTLCLELNDSLVHLVWDKDYGWRIATRPGVKQFLAYMSRYYELVIFTTSQNYVAAPVIETLDPYHYVMYNLYRDSTRLMGIKHVKDLSCLNRDLGKVIVVDTDPENFQLQPENGIQLKAWKGEEDDEELSKLMKLLEEMALLASIVNLNDLRPIMKSFKALAEKSEDPWSGWVARKEQLRADFAESDRRRNGDVAQPVEGSLEVPAAQPSTVSSIVNSITGALFGGRGMTTPQGQQPAAAQPGASVSGSNLKRTNLIDLIEHAGKEEYTLFLKEQKEQIKQMEEAKKKHEEEALAQIEAMKAKKLKLFDYMMGAGNEPIAAPGAPGVPEASGK